MKSLDFQKEVKEKMTCYFFILKRFLLHKKLSLYYILKYILANLLEAETGKTGRNMYGYSHGNQLI